MLYLILSILSSTIILLLFKWIEKLKINLLVPIVVNYFSASLFGFILSKQNPIQILTDQPVWIYFSIIIGIFLIVNFYLIGTSTQKAGIAITTIAAKMSFVLPVIFSLIYDVNDQLNLNKLLLLIVAVFSVFLMVGSSSVNKKNPLLYFLPLLIFFGLGILDTLIKYCQYHYIHTAQDSSIFSAVNFSVSAIVGLILLIVNKNTRGQIFKIKSLAIGAALGIANFGSMYFLINALNALKFSNSLVLGVNNIGIVAISVLIALIIFREKLSVRNYIGIVLSFLVLIGMLISIQ